MSRNSAHYNENSQTPSFKIAEGNFKAEHSALGT
jgi:hypothetical protein